MNVRKLLCIAIIVCVTLSLISIVPATSPTPVATHLVLAEKPHSGDNPADYSTWSFAMWGQLDYYTPWATFDYAFDGHGLAPNTAYTLIYYPDPYPGNNLICIDHGTSNATGGIILHGSTNIGALPKAYDANINTGAKIWLVLSSDVDCSSNPHHMTAWQPTLYLFELWLIQYTPSLPTITVTQTVTSPTTTTTTVTLPRTTVTIPGATSTVTLPGTTVTLTLPGTTVTVAAQTVTQTLTTTKSTTQTVTLQQSTCPVTTTTHTTHTSTTSITTRTTTTKTSPCRQRICGLHYTPIRWQGISYDVVVPCDAVSYGCYTYTDSKGQVWQVCRTVTYAPGPGPICNDC